MYFGNYLPAQVSSHKLSTPAPAATAPKQQRPARRTEAIAHIGGAFWSSSRGKQGPETTRGWLPVSSSTLTAAFTGVRVSFSTYQTALCGFCRRPVQCYPDRQTGRGGALSHRRVSPQWVLPTAGSSQREAGAMRFRLKNEPETSETHNAWGGNRWGRDQ